MPEPLALAERATGRRALLQKRLVGGESSEVYKVLLEGGGAVVVRLHADPSVYAATRRNLELLAGLGLPVPKVLLEERGALVLARIPGTDLRFVLPQLSDAQIGTIAERVAGYQRTVIASLGLGRGYGWVGIGEAGPHATWKDAIGLKRQTDARLLAAAKSLGDYLDHVAPTGHLDDITGKNVLIENGELAGLIDFDVVCYGDPHFWLGLTAAGVLADCGPRELRYSNALTAAFGVDAAGRRAAAFYSAWIAAEFVERFAESEPTEWRARMEAGIDRWLTEAAS